MDWVDLYDPTLHVMVTADHGMTTISKRRVIKLQHMVHELLTLSIIHIIILRYPVKIIPSIFLSLHFVGIKCIVEEEISLGLQNILCPLIQMFFGGTSWGFVFASKVHMGIVVF